MVKIRLLIIGIIIGFLFSSIINYIYNNESTTLTFDIKDKYERNGGCYILIEKEVTPENYIGYDIGDEFEL